MLIFLKMKGLNRLETGRRSCEQKENHMWTYLNKAARHLRRDLERSREKKQIIRRTTG